MPLEDLKRIVGEGGWSDDPDELAPYLREWRGQFQGRSPLLLKPASTDAVAAIMQCCSADGTAVVPQGGNTGMCGGAVPDTSGRQIVLSLQRMNRIQRVDAADDAIHVEAGCILANVQAAARAADRHLGLSLSAEGSCQIGGNIATNAGGINVLRYGTARAQVLGLEVVLASGQVLDMRRSLRKDTAGYDLKQVFIGSEGTLGIVTGAVLRLYPRPGRLATAFVGLADAGDAVRLLGHLRASRLAGIEAYELISADIFDLLLRHIPGARPVFEHRYPWYVLTDLDTGDDDGIADTVLAAALERDLAASAVLAKSAAEAEGLWRLRHCVAEAERADGPALKHDISVPVGALAGFLDAAAARLAAAGKGVRPLVFGHVGDGNLHYNVRVAQGANPEAVTESLYDVVSEFGGSISAEHGIGQLKRDWLPRYRSTAELETMRALKRALDPQNILNPGKVI